MKSIQRLLDTLSASTGENEQRRRLAEMTRKFTVMRINESILSRKYTHVVHSERLVSMERDYLNRAICVLDAKVAESVAELRKEKVGRQGFYLVAHIR
jgi:hypothetical protein